MKIVICGLGYVGVTTAACLVRDGHIVVGVDVDPEKIAAVGAGRSPVSEAGVEALLADGVRQGRLSAVSEIGSHLDDANIVLISVGTPSLASGGHDLSYLRGVAGEIGVAIAARPSRTEGPLVVVRSTIVPGTMEDVVLPAIAAAAGCAPGDGYEVAFNPEFLRESTAIADYDSPAKIVIGERETGVSRRLRGLYDAIDAPVFEMPFAAAEMVKLVDNGYHALKVAFGNEVGRLALDLDVDGQAVIDAFLTDTRLNISPAYFRPGGPFGGPCLAKDLRAVNALAQARGTDLPVLGSVLASNTAHKSFLANRVMARAMPGETILLLGLSFKSDTDDLRESPMVDLAETLIGKGFDLRIHDPDLQGRTLIGANLRYVEEHLPHLSKLLVDDIAELPAIGLVVIGKPMAAIVASLDPACPVIDLTRI